MSTPDHSMPSPQNTGWGNAPEGVFSLDVISRLANAIYQEDFTHAPPNTADAPAQPSLPPGPEAMLPLPDAAQSTASQNPAERLSAHTQQTQQAEHLGFQPEISERAMPSHRVAPTEQDFYFLQPAQNMQHSAPAIAPPSMPVPTTAQPAPPPTTEDAGMFDLSGERCLLAPILPKIVGPDLAEKMIAMAGRPTDNMQAVGQPMHEIQAREPYATSPYAGYAPAETPQTAKQQNTEQLLYFQQFEGQVDQGQTLYFQHDAERPPQEAKPAFVKPEASAPKQKPEPDWSDYRMFNPEVIRKDFPVLQQTVNGKPLVWLDNAATTQKPQSVIDALSRFYERDNSNIHRGAHTLAARATDAYENAREKIRQFVGAGSKDEIIYVRGTTEGINLVANTFGRQRVGPGDEIILSELEHHANIVPWQMLAQEKGAKLRVIPINGRGDIMLGAYERLFNPRTRIVALGQVSNALGTVVPVHEMIATAHRYGVPVMVDGAQSVQHMAVNVQEMDADFFVFSGHKLFAPTGIGAVYGKKEHLEMMPPWQGGGNMIDRVTFEETTYNGVPAKFEAGTPSIGDAIGLGAAIDYVRKIGLENIHRYETELMEYMVAALIDIPGLQIIGNPTHRAGALSFVMKNIPTTTMGQLLDREGIAVRSGHHCAQPALRHFGHESSVRPSLAFYNTKHDVDRLRAAILKMV